MKYMGSKARFAKEILPIILNNRKPNQWYIETMVGGANLIDKVDGNRIAFDSNKYLIAMIIELQNGWIPEKINKKQYNHIRKNFNEYPDYLIGWAGINCSYSGKWFGGFAGVVKTKGGIRDYQQEAINNVAKQIKNLKDVIFSCKNYLDVSFPDNSIIYFDPPYEGTTRYKDDFNHVEFWDFVRERRKDGHSVFISEYNAPVDFTCVWSREAKSSLSANGKIGGNKISIEKLFTI